MNFHRGAQMVQLVEHLTSAQVIISWFMGSIPTLGSVLTSSEPEACFRFFLSLSLSLSLCLSPSHTQT